MVGTEARGHLSAEFPAPVVTINEAGDSPFVLVCDHASNRIPKVLDGLGLRPHERLMHIAWDPGALAVALRLTELLDAPLVHSTVSRLVVDCNRTETAPDLIPVVSELTAIPGNAELEPGERLTRVARYHTPFHAAITELLDRRAAAGEETILVTVHSYTPVYKGVRRPWPIGLIHGLDTRFTRALGDALLAEWPDLRLGWNEPYAALNGVTHTLEHHGDGRGLACTMIEIRHDEILEPAGATFWSDRLARALERARGSLLAAGPVGARQPISTGGIHG